MTEDEFRDEASSPARRERDEAADAQWQHLISDELDEAQFTEIRRRIRALDAGQTETIPGEQVMRELRNRHAR